MQQNTLQKYVKHVCVAGFIVVAFLLSTVDAQAQPVEKVVRLEVPFATQIPDGKWVRPYSEACEESSIVMIDAYYEGRRGVIGHRTSKERMQPYFDYQDERYGDNDDSNAWRTGDMVHSLARYFKAEVVEYPALRDIQAELRAGRPVMTFHHGYSLQNKRIPFSNTPESFHVIVLVGYDENSRQFIVHEPGMRRGSFYRYDYDVIMKSMADYNHETGKTTDPPRAIFTSEKKDAKRTDMVGVISSPTRSTTTTANNMLFVVNYIGTIFFKMNFVDNIRSTNFNYLQS
ncbi:MAG: C39 family peptidase [Candidatus Magasanikbacteria bacterium]